jgi:hypothetical protein
MSDIGVLGVGSLVGALAAIALGLLGALLGFIVGLAAGSRGESRVLAYCAGPIACFAVGCIALALVENALFNLPDSWGLVWLGAGIAAWVAIALSFRRRKLRA